MNSFTHTRTSMLSVLTRKPIRIESFDRGQTELEIRQWALPLRMNWISCSGHIYECPRSLCRWNFPVVRVHWFVNNRSEDINHCRWTNASKQRMGFLVEGEKRLSHLFIAHTNDRHSLERGWSDIDMEPPNALIGRIYRYRTVLHIICRFRPRLAFNSGGCRMSDIGHHRDCIDVHEISHLRSSSWQ